MSEVSSDLQDLFRQLSTGEITDEELQAEVDDLRTSSHTEKSTRPVKNGSYAEDYFTEENVGSLFADEIRGQTVAVDEWKGWAQFDSETGVWDQCPTGRVNTLAADWLNELYKDTKARGSESDAKAALRYRSVVPRQHVVESAFGRVLVSSTEFDQNNDALLAGNGVVDLSTGDLREASASDMFLKHSSVRYVKGAKHEGWDAILSAFPDDVLPYLQTIVGQALTGYQPSDASVYFFHGSGRNGKSSFIDVIREIAGDYASSPSSSVLLQSQGSSDSSLMVFKGLRVAIFEELPDNRILDPYIVKRLSGTQVLRAAQKYQREEEFPVIATSFITTNHLPRVPEMEFGTWRRLKVIPTPYTFLPEEQCTEPHHRPARNDMEDLKHDPAVLEAALAWAVEGSVNWYSNRRTEPSIPDSMKSAQLEWKADNDKVGSWWTDAVEEDENSFCLVIDLYDSYAAHLKSHGLRSEALRTFVAALKDHDMFKQVGAEHKQKARHSNLHQSIYDTGDEFSEPRRASSQATFVKGIRFQKN